MLRVHWDGGIDAWYNVGSAKCECRRPTTRMWTYSKLYSTDARHASRRDSRAWSRRLCREAKSQSQAEHECWLSRRRGDGVIGGSTWELERDRFDERDIESTPNAAESILRLSKEEQGEDSASDAIAAPMALEKPSLHAATRRTLVLYVSSKYPCALSSSSSGSEEQ
jgi:hypothetical protein